MRTHVEFTSGGKRFVMPCHAVSVVQYGDKWHVEHGHNPDCSIFVSPETADRLIRELLGSAEAEPAAEPQYVLHRYACLDASGWVVQTFAGDEDGRRLAKAWRDLPENLGIARVVPLYIRREDAT